MTTDPAKFYIGGAWVDPLPGARPLDVENPATRDVLATISLGTEADVDSAVTAARGAFESYADTTLAQRTGWLRRLREIYAERFEEMAQTISQELGAPITLSREQQAAAGLSHIDAFLAALENYEEEWRHANGDLLRREPVGVCALITPWNWPINQIALKVIPALVTGNCCVLKPSEMTPLSALLFAEMVIEAGFPAGSFNLVNGDGPGVGAELSAHPEVDMVSFTGSTRAGTAVSHAAAESVKRVTLELGGKSANMVFADADLDAATEFAVMGCMENSGQSCDAPTRLLVERAVYDEMLERVTRRASEVTVGDPSAEGTHIGPLVSKLQWDRVQALIAKGLEEGAEAVVGGAGTPEGKESSLYARPTVFAGVTPEMSVAEEEIFGPVLSVLPFETEDEGIALANRSRYGLAAYLSTSDPERAARVSRRLRAGMVHVNGQPLGEGSPFGGYKLSGNGREGGLLGLEDFTEVKVVASTFS